MNVFSNFRLQIPTNGLEGFSNTSTCGVSQEHCMATIGIDFVGSCTLRNFRFWNGVSTKCTTSFSSSLASWDQPFHKIVPFRKERIPKPPKSKNLGTPVHIHTRNGCFQGMSFALWWWQIESRGSMGVPSRVVTSSQRYTGKHTLLSRKFLWCGEHHTETRLFSLLQIWAVNNLPIATSAPLKKMYESQCSTLLFLKAENVNADCKNCMIVQSRFCTWATFAHIFLAKSDVCELKRELLAEYKWARSVGISSLHRASQVNPTNTSLPGKATHLCTEIQEQAIPIIAVSQH